MTPSPARPDKHAPQQPQVRLEATASGEGQVYQSARDQFINPTVLPEAALRPVTEVSAPPRLVYLPRHTHTFVGRGDELAVLEAALRGGGEVVVAAVHGLGGVGKSTLAAHYALAQATGRTAPGQERKAGGGLNPVWWIIADSGSAVEAGLAGLAVALQPELTTVLPLEALAERATAWLAAHDGWLLVLDNVVDPADVRPLLERTLTGQVLVTSRLGEGWHHLDARVLRLDVLDEREAIELLARLATPGLPRGLIQAALDREDLPDGLDGAVDLVRELGHLPLAIEQVGAYLHQTKLPPRAYLRLLREQPAIMYDRAARGGDAERTVARIWRLTLDQLIGVPLAGQVLRILAWYGTEPIPRTLLASLDAEVSQVQHALSELAAYNMITLSSETVTVHRLVQAVARTPDPNDPHRQAAAIDTARGQATSLLHDDLPYAAYDPIGWPTWRALLPHITALASHISPGTETANTARLINQAGLFLYNQGAIGRAIACFEQAHMANERALGVDHPNTLKFRSNLANAYRAAGDLGRAIALHEATLADCERVLGVDHPNTLNSRNNLAGAYQEAGDLGRATALHEQTLVDHERVLGTDHPRTMVSRNDLAYAYQEAGDLDRAIVLYEQTLADRERALGADHPSTLVSRNNLAYAYRAAGHLDRAIPLYEQTLADSERVLGTDHPDMLVSRNNLARALKAVGNLGRAIPLHEQTLADHERVVGPDHPNTLRFRNNLAYAYRAAGDLGRATALFEQTLADRERVLGADHPDTLVSRHNLAGAYQEGGDLGRAIPLYEQTLADRERVLGTDHPHTLASRHNLATAYQAVGNLGRAIPMYEQTLAACERVLGADHPTTKAVRGNLEALR